MLVTADQFCVALAQNASAALRDLDGEAVDAAIALRKILGASTSRSGYEAEAHGNYDLAFAVPSILRMERASLGEPLVFRLLLAAEVLRTGFSLGGEAQPWTSLIPVTCEKSAGNPGFNNQKAAPGL